MDYSEFTGEVQDRIDAGNQDEAVRTTRAVLETLGERLSQGGATDLASPLPMEIDRYLLDVENEQKYDRDEFIERVEEKMNYEDLRFPTGYSRPAPVDQAEVAYRIKTVIALLAEKVPEGEINDIQKQLPAEFEELFEFVDAENPPWEQEN